jgi:transposase InsO family protein
VTRYRWIDQRKAEGFQVAAACQVAQVCSSAYYEWRAEIEAGRGRYERAWSDAIVVNEIVDVHRHLDPTYGSPRMTAELRRRGHCINEKRTERLMRENGMCARDARRKKVRTTIPDVTAPPLPDLIGRDFAVGEPGLRTCGDITYVGTAEGWLYVASVLDLGSRRLVGYAMDERMPAELIGRALDMAAEFRGGVRGMVFHHDRGSQYLSREFRERCELHGVVQSVGRIGSSHDNAVAESFWATLKRECVERHRFETRADARRAIIAWINHYNAVRLHSTIGNVTPIEWELAFARRQLQAA